MDETILAVDDDPEFLAGVTMTLSSAGYHVITAHNGEEALQRLPGQRVDLIVADVAMPHMNGYQLFQTVSASADWGLIPFVLLSGRDLDSDVRFGKELGVDDYLVKPVAAADLLAAVRGKLQLARQRYHALAASQSLAPPPSSPAPAAAPVHRLGSLHIEPARHQAWRGDRLLSLSPREFKLLVYLAQQHPSVVGNQELVEATHDLETSAADAGALMRSLVRSLRRKLGYPPGETGCIVNHRGIGYQLVEAEA